MKGQNFILASAEKPVENKSERVSLPVDYARYLRVE